MHHLPSFPAGVFAKSQKDSRSLGFFLPATASWGGLKPPSPQVAVNGYPEILTTRRLRFWFLYGHGF